MRKRLMLAVALALGAVCLAVPLAASGKDDRGVTIGVRLDFSATPVVGTSPRAAPSPTAAPRARL